MGKVICPKCEKDDQIQKVTSIVTNGVATTNYQVSNAYGSGSGTSVSQTHLSSRLSLPAKPVYKPNLMINVALFIGALLVGALIDVLSQSNIFSCLSLLIGMGLVVWFSVNPSNEHKTLLSGWERKFANWSELYYCYRDDCVFDPKTNKYTSPEGMSRLLE